MKELLVRFTRKSVRWEELDIDTKAKSLPISIFFSGWCIKFKAFLASWLRSRRCHGTCQCMFGCFDTLVNSLEFFCRLKKKTKYTMCWEWDFSILCGNYVIKTMQITRMLISIVTCHLNLCIIRYISKNGYQIWKLLRMCWNMLFFWIFLKSMMCLKFQNTVYVANKAHALFIAHPFFQLIYRIFCWDLRKVFLS